MFSYIHESGNSKFLDYKLIFLSGSPELDNSGAIPTGRLSGIVNHHIPSWLKGNQLPSYQTNIVDDWEEKLERIVDETLDHRMGLISGIPPCAAEQAHSVPTANARESRSRARRGNRAQPLFVDRSTPRAIPPSA